jgi:hypothetical protein
VGEIVDTGAGRAAAALASGEKPALKGPLDEFFQDLNSNPAFRMPPVTYEVALEVASPGFCGIPPTVPSPQPRGSTGSGW